MRFFNNKWPAILLWPFSVLYGLIISLRNLFYDWQLFKIHHLDCNVISVGNITVGGTGKTPTVIFLAKWYFNRGKKVCVLSRGYGRSSRGTVIVSNMNQVLANVQQSGDEPFLIANRLHGIPVIVDEDRVRGGKQAMDKFNPDIIILDDGFQHRRLHRDLDIVSFKSNSMFGNSYTLPAGPLRENKKSLKRADILWINACDDTCPEIEVKTNKPHIFAQYNSQRIFNVSGDTSLHDLAGKQFVGFCGLANPDHFKTTLLALDIDLVHFLSFEDHHHYTMKDMSTLISVFNKSTADGIITTEKDWVKIHSLIKNDPKWYCLAIDLVPINKSTFENIFCELF